MQERRAQGFLVLVILVEVEKVAGEDDRPVVVEIDADPDETGRVQAGAGIGRP